MSKFQIILLGIFIVCIIIGVVAFATYKGSSSESSYPAVTVWGTFPADVLNKYVADINGGLSSPITVNYTQKTPSQFSNDFIAALARGQGPDAILLPADMLLPHLDKIASIPFSAFPKRTYIDSYINEAQIYLNSAGIAALPFTIDPLIMYWNKDTFNASGFATYPRYWDEFNSLNAKLTQKDQNGNLRKSAIALGTFNNINNAREILGTILMQLGNPVTARDANGKLVTTISNSFSVSPKQAIQFFGEAVNPSSSYYSWNRGMIDDRTAFLSGTLATYFGFASELADLRTKNPNINYDAAAMPQIRTGGVKATYGRMYGFSLVKSSSILNSTYQVISILGSPYNLSKLAQTMYLPAIHLQAMSQANDDPYISIFNQSALIARSWLDADPIQSRKVFNNMIEYYTSGQKSLNETIETTYNQYNLLLNSVTQ